jgi:type II secretory pathway component PulF
MASLSPIAAAVVDLFALRRWLGSSLGSPAPVGGLAFCRFPVVGPLLAQFAMARFCRMLGTLLGAGRSAHPGSLNVARRSIGNQSARRRRHRNRSTASKRDKPLGTSLARNRALFPGAVDRDDLRGRRERGKLDRELLRIAGMSPKAISTVS